MTNYILGSSDLELDRLILQQEVWGPITERFFDRLGIPEGGRCLDLGCGPGLVLESLRERVGPTGSVVALDESEKWHAHMTGVAAGRGWDNVELVRARIEELSEGGGSGALRLEPGSFDLVWMRWVLSFLPDPAAVVRAAARLLRPGGVLAIQDYNHEGVSLFPESEGFRKVIRATRAWYAAGGGDTWVAARLPGCFRAAKLELCDYVPNVICGGPGSDAFRWADAFFPVATQNMVEQGVLEAQERALFLREWELRSENPDTVFFSPIVVDAAARRPV